MVKVETRLEKIQRLRYEMIVMEDSSMLIGTNEKKEKENARRGIY